MHLFRYFLHRMRFSSELVMSSISCSFFPGRKTMPLFANGWLIMSGAYSLSWISVLSSPFATSRAPSISVALFCFSFILSPAFSVVVVCLLLYFYICKLALKKQIKMLLFYLFFSKKYLIFTFIFSQAVRTAQFVEVQISNFQKLFISHHWVGTPAYTIF